MAYSSRITFLEYAILSKPASSVQSRYKRRNILLKRDVEHFNVNSFPFFVKKNDPSHNQSKEKFFVSRIFLAYHRHSL